MVKLVYERTMSDRLRATYTIYGERDVIHYTMYKLQKRGYCMIHKEEEGIEYIILKGNSFFDYSEHVEEEFNAFVKLIDDIVQSYKALKQKETKRIVIYYNTDSDDDNNEE